LAEAADFLYQSGNGVAQAIGFFKAEVSDVIAVSMESMFHQGKSGARFAAVPAVTTAIRSLIAELWVRSVPPRQTRDRQPDLRATGRSRLCARWVLGQITDDELKVLQDAMFKMCWLRDRRSLNSPAAAAEIRA